MNLKRLNIFIIVWVFGFQLASAQTPNIKLGFGISHLYDLYEGPLELSGTTGNVSYDIVDIDLKGMNGTYTQFDVGLSVLSEVELNNGFILPPKPKGIFKRKIRAKHPKK